MTNTDLKTEAMKTIKMPEDTPHIVVKKVVNGLDFADKVHWLTYEKDSKDQSYYIRAEYTFNNETRVACFRTPTPTSRAYYR